MLKRYQNYAQSNPLSSWLIGVAVLFALNLTFFRGSLGPRNPEHLLWLAVFTLSAPTANLLTRLSEEQRRERPVPPRQEEGIGLLSLSALGVSLGAWGTLALHKHMGLSLPTESAHWLLHLFSASALLSLGAQIRGPPDAGRALGACGCLRRG